VLSADEELPSPCALADILNCTFEEIQGYDGMILLRGIGLELGFEHGSPTPLFGVVHIAYLPNQRVVGISKFARVVDALAQRLESQERLTVHIADIIDAVLRPRGVAVTIEVRHRAATVIACRMLGVFRSDPDLRREFHTLLRLRS